MNTLNAKEWLRNCFVVSFLLIVISFPNFTHAESNRSDYDLDNDGLIEINDLSDLNEMRNNLDGKSLYGSSKGCPKEGCLGFELTQDLDFDTNQNGKIDEGDTYWNANAAGVGEGWEPIGDYGKDFRANFDGNGYRILNLYINRPTALYVGLFGRFSGDELTGVGLTGRLTSIVGSSNTGALIGAVSILSNVKVSKSYSTGRVIGKSQVGGLIGSVFRAQIEHCFTTGLVKGIESVGGLVGESSGVVTGSFSTGVVFGSTELGGLVGKPGLDVLINESFSTGRVPEVPASGGLVGFSYNTNQSINNSYWATSSSGQQYSFLESEQNNYVGLSLPAMQCAIKGSMDYTNSDCVSQGGSDENLESGIILFNGWESSGVWDFGREYQLPGLILYGKLFRDSDGDGVLDESDDAPNNYAYSNDRDGDGYPDAWSLGCDETCRGESGLVLDQFPENDQVWLDLDLDGFVDAWPADCNESCQADSGLLLDGFLGDTDNDGIKNNLDADDNGDNNPDVDSDSDGLIEIATLDQLNAMRFQLDGRGYRASISGTLDTSGCPILLHEGRYEQRCKGYELVQDLNFDSNDDGVLNGHDQYSNMNAQNIVEGWLPIGEYRQPFSGVFDGNNHVIKNLHINRREAGHIGLFGSIDHARLQNFGLSGPLTKVVGGRYVGAVVGSINHLSEVKNVYNTGSVHGNSSFGGIVGYADSNNKILSSFNTGRIGSTEYHGASVGGLVGEFHESNTIRNVFNSGAIIGRSDVGGLLGYNYREMDINSSYNVGLIKRNGYKSRGLIGSSNGGSGRIQNSYWTTDSSEMSDSDRPSEENNYIGLPLSVLQCATENQINNQSCFEPEFNVSVFYGWDKGELNDKATWNFGTQNQLPGLTINDFVYRDSDADGVLDHEDHWPQLYAVAMDDDQDGFPDQWTQNCDENCIAASGLVLDQFPLSAAGWKDEDLDGLLDEWAESCDIQCQSSSGLFLDDFLDDSNNDGVNNFIGSDDNGDGIEDADSDSDGLIEISNLKQLSAIRFQLDGMGRRLADNGELDKSGCPFRNINGIYQQACRGYELSQDLDFDTNQDGYFYSGDSYWNGGRGWEPIGDDEKPFLAEFEGNNFSIKNLHIDTAYRKYSGLFGYIDASRISGIKLENVHLFISDKNYRHDYSSYVGALVAYAGMGNTIRDIYVSGDVTGMETVGGVIGTTSRNNVITAVHSEALIVIESDRSIYDVGGVVASLGSYNQLTALFNSGSISIKNRNSNARIGGLVGRAGSDNKIVASLNTGLITSELSSGAYIGGLVGFLYDNSHVKSSYSTGYINTLDSSFDSVGGLIGNQDLSTDSYTVENSYWLNDSSDSVLRYIDNENTSHIGLPLSILQCATSANVTFENGDCVSVDGHAEGLLNSLILFKGWDQHELNGAPIWDFGNEHQLPALNINGQIKRDSDGDSVFDENDAFPFSWSASIDLDKDGYPESWTVGCGYLCQNDSGLFFDQFPYDSSVGKDSDKDGLVDEWGKNCDLDCQAASRWEFDEHLNDTDNDGIVNSVDEDDDNNGRLDVDRDHNGLIEITTLTQLNAMRYQLDGIGYRASDNHTLDQSGCPFVFFEGAVVQRCYGYELKNDLNFDTNNDGEITGLDQYWNDGKGWEPVGKPIRYAYALDAFSAHFDGNGYKIKNVYINRSKGESVGLFSSVKNTTIKRLGLTGTMMSISGSASVGALAGTLYRNVKIQKCYSLGRVSGEYVVGGLIGDLRSKNIILNSFSSSKVIKESQYSSFFGGLVGKIYSNNLVSNSFSVGKVSSNRQSGGLIGLSLYSEDATNHAGSPNKIMNSYWALDSSAQSGSAGLPQDGNYVGYALQNLQCPDSANKKVGSEACFEMETDLYGENNQRVLYNSWDETIWDFGSKKQLPGLILNGVVHRDSDGDGLLDENDLFVFDSDNDGVPKEIDAFPFIAAASVDGDGDGYPDIWSDGCGLECQQNSGLQLDMDDDNDGVTDAYDAFPSNISASLDEDGDGRPDEWNTNCDQQCIDESGLHLDLLLEDSDNDGVVNSEDAFEKNPAAAVDVDADGKPDYWLDTCSQTCQEHSGLVLDLDDDNDGVEDHLDSFPINFAAFSDEDNDGFPDAWNPACDLECRKASGLILDTELDDSDNDGAVNTLDKFPQNADASVDNDHDGFPDGWSEACDLTCQSDSILTLDTLLNDTDNDAVENDRDHFINNSAASQDTDGDGKPDDWHLSCDQLCQAASGLYLDEDDDNDGVADNVDAFSLIFAASQDLDGDGFPDYWHPRCDVLCKNESNLILDTSLFDTDNDGIKNNVDAFINNSAASVDTDGDGKPDDWNEYCHLECQIASQLTLDEDDDNDGVRDENDAFPIDRSEFLDTDGDGIGNNADPDDDNDGVLDKNDSDIARDDGLPELIQVPMDLKLQVTSEDGAHAILNWSQEQYLQFRAYDVVDIYDLVYEAMLNGVRVDISADAEVQLPSGHLELLWRAKDRAGNYSNTLVQKIDVYPRVRFSQAESITGDESKADVGVELTGEPPEYPVIVEFKVSLEKSDIHVNQEDFSAAFNIESVHTLSITEPCNDGCLNPKSIYQIPIERNTIDEVNEQLTLELTGINGASESGVLFVIDDQRKEHILTISYENLAPEVSLMLEHNGNVVTNPILNEGVIAVKAIIDDKNDLDEHTLEWDLGNITNYTILEDTVYFNAAELSSGNYSVSVHASDLVENSLSGSAEITFVIVTAKKNVIKANDAGAGSLNRIWLLMLILLLWKDFYKRRVYKAKVIIN